jgi:hypothetical protein
VFAIVPACGGPSPDLPIGGDCYHINAPVAMMLDVKTWPALAACF